MLSMICYINSLFDDLCLGAEMGNISEARSLGNRLAKSSASDTEDDGYQNRQDYLSSSPGSYTSLSREARQTTYHFHNDRDEPRIVVTE